MSEPLWTHDVLVAATGGRALGPQPGPIAGISIDSRTIQPGEAFFAIRGETFDGHDFVADALARGAATAVVSEARAAELSAISGSLTVVADVLDALRDLGRAARARSGARIAAVTGSVGKTGTKQMLAAALAADGPVHSSPASFNNHWGVPLTLARMPQSARYAVFEIGMNHAGEIAPLVRMVRPHAAIVTAIEPVHLEYFDDVDAIARAKGEIFLGVEPGGAAIINRDNPYWARLAGLAAAAGIQRIIGFGEHPEAAARLHACTLKEQCSCVSARILDDEVAYKLAVPGRHIIQNSLAVLAAVAVLGGDLAKAALALAAVPAPKGRGTRHGLAVGGGKALLIDESYNANPASMRAAIAVLAQTPPGMHGRRIAVLGDMRELGEDAAVLHADLAAHLVAAGIDRVFVAGPLMAALWQALPARLHGGYGDSAAALEAVLFDTIRPGDVIMVKGSNASRMGRLVEALKARFAAGREVANRPEEDAA